MLDDRSITASKNGVGSALPIVSVLICSRDRPEALARCLESVLSQRYPQSEIVVLDDASRRDIVETLEPCFRGASIRWVRSEQRLGVAGARNRLVQEAAGEILVFLDDDAVLESPDALGTVVTFFSRTPELGTLAFKIMARINGHVDLQVPFSRRWRKRNPLLTESTGPVSYYVGAGHAIRKEAFRRCGLYQESLVYGDEELDHAYRQVEAGFSLVYTPEVLVDHFPAASEVESERDGRKELFYVVRNRIWNAYKHIPLPYLVSYVGVWVLYFLAASIRERHLGEFLRGAYTGFAGFRSLPRKPLDALAVAYLRANYGRLWY